MHRRRADLSPPDAGFITPVFAGVLLTVSLVAAAILLVARQDFLESDRDARRTAQALWLEGVAIQSALRVATTAGQPVLRWTQGSAYGVLDVIVEPEDRKAAPQSAERPENVLLIGRLVGPREAAGLASAVSGQVGTASGQVRRAEIAGLSAERRWRDCATTIFSPYSRLTTLAPDLPEPGPAATPHTGELWRISVIARDGGFIDQIVRLTDDPRRAVEVVEQRAGQDRHTYRRQCWTLLQPPGSPA
jgi:hypothetical protein